MKCYDTLLFIEIIQSDPRVKYLGAAVYEGYTSSKFTGTKGGLIIIDTSDEEIDEVMGKTYLTQLGLDDLIKPLYSVEIQEPSEIE